MLTDYRGRFSMAVPPGSTLLFSLEGMINAEANVANRKTLNVLLKREGMEEDTADIAFVEPVEEDNLSYKPQPENGTMSYRNYLKKNLKYPEEARKHNIQGNVRVEFTVMPDGKLAGFMIKRGLGYGCDEEALRLVQEGPAWKPALANGKKVEKRITVFVPFKL
jgi:TonB family protein